MNYFCYQCKHGFSFSFKNRAIPQMFIKRRFGFEKPSTQVLRNLRHRVGRFLKTCPKEAHKPPQPRHKNLLYNKPSLVDTNEGLSINSQSNY